MYYKDQEINLDIFEKKIKYKFKNIELLKKALRHKSYANERGIESNEKLEFLGDCILEYVTSFYLYNNYSNLKEGEMTKVRSTVVCEDSLYEVALRNDFSDFLFVGRSERKNNCNIRKAILADSVEAVIAAIHLDSGIEEAKRFIISNLKDSIDFETKHVGMKDYKTVLQEKLQAIGETSIRYELIKEEGPEHEKIFTEMLYNNDIPLAEGHGRTKKEAQMEAAKKALENIK